MAEPADVQSVGVGTRAYRLFLMTLYTTRFKTDLNKNKVSRNTMQLNQSHLLIQMQMLLLLLEPLLLFLLLLF